MAMVSTEETFVTSTQYAKDLIMSEYWTNLTPRCLSCEKHYIRQIIMHIEVDKTRNETCHSDTCGN